MSWARQDSDMSKVDEATLVKVDTKEAGTNSTFDMDGKEKKEEKKKKKKEDKEENTRQGEESIVKEPTYPWRRQLGENERRPFRTEYST